MSVNAAIVHKLELAIKEGPKIAVADKYMEKAIWLHKDAQENSKRILNSLDDIENKFYEHIKVQITQAVIVGIEQVITDTINDTVNKAIVAVTGKPKAE